MIFNKVDLINDDEVLKSIQEKYPQAIVISASKRIRLQRIKEEILHFIESNYLEKEYRIVHRQAKIVNSLYSLSSVIEERYQNDHVYIRCKISKEDAQRIDKMIEKLSHELAIEDFLK
jgi:GTP-binding protein HflX